MDVLSWKSKPAGIALQWFKHECTENKEKLFRVEPFCIEMKWLDRKYKLIYKEWRSVDELSWKNNPADIALQWFKHECTENTENLFSVEPFCIEMKRFDRKYKLIY